MATVTLQQVLNPTVQTVAPTTTLAEVWRRMENQRISCVVVLAEHRPVGIFSERDSVVLVARGGWQETDPISRYMQEPVLASNLGMDTHRAYRLMAARNRRHLVVVDAEGALRGLVTEGDLLHFIGLENVLQPRSVASAMTGKVVTLEHRDTLLAAARVMAEQVLSCVVVLRDGRPAGILSERDVVRLARHGCDPAATLLAEVMSQPLSAVRSDDLLAIAMQRMEQAGIRRLVVLDAAGEDAGEVMVGLLTRHDVVKALQQHYVELLQETIDRLETDLHITRDRLDSVEHRLLRHSVMDQVNDAVLVAAIEDGRVVEANEQLSDMLGYSRAELLSLHCHQFAELYDGADTWAAFAAALAQSGRQITETRFIHKEGARFPVEISLRLVHSEGRAYLVAAARDIARRKQDEARIRLDREQQRVLREILEIGIGEGTLQARLSRCLERLLSVSWLTLLPKAGLFAMEAAGLRLLADHNLSPETRACCSRVALGHCLCGRAAETGFVEYADRVDPRHEIEYPGMPDHGHYSVPLRAGDEVLGVLVLYLPVGHPQILAEREFLEAVAGALAGLLGRNRAELATQAKEAEICLLLDSTAEAIFGVDMENRCTFVNRACLDLLGYDSAEELLGQRIHTLIHHSHADGRPYPEHECPALPGVSLHEKRHSENEVFWRKDGTVVPVEFWSHPVVQQGKLVGAVITFMDISQRKLTEEKLRLAAKVFDSTLEGVMVTDADTRILFVNHAFSTITGYSEDEVVGKTPQILGSGRHDREFHRQIWSDIEANGGWQGEIWNRNKAGAEYPEWLSINTVHDPAGGVVNYVGVFADISQIKASQAQLEHLARHDPLTGLPNRTLFQSRLSHAINVAQRHGHGLGLLFMDLDGFKNINDSRGHPVGDELLQGIARRLADNLRAIDTLARLGGDEFVILLEDLEEPQEAAVVAQNVLALLRQPFPLSDGHEVFTGVSIGISLYPDDARDASQLVRNADAALYQAKSQGRGTYRFYTEALTQIANDRQRLESRLRGALDRGEFVVHYQPQVAVRGGRLIGAEALVRWQTPEGELIHPAHFIPLAEETGLIRPLGEWVLREACSQFRAWFDAGLPAITLAVNLSSRQFEQRDLVERLHALLAETGFPAHLLELDITESAIMAQGTRAAGVLAALKRLGVSLAIDGFGTGYSSLAGLKRFAVDKLKIDRSFIHDIPQDLNDVEIAATIVAMAKNLKLKVLAAGVETEAQLGFLQTHDCDAYQGYLYSRPLPAADFLALFRRGGPRRSGLSRI